LLYILVVCILERSLCAVGEAGMVKIKKMVKIDRHIGRRIRSRRNELRLTQKTLASRLGVMIYQFRKYERGINRVSAATLFALAAELDAPVAFFFSGLEPKSASPGTSSVKSVGFHKA
jgi:DNA-binding XRE family transcriptional regulator